MSIGSIVHHVGSFHCGWEKISNDHHLCPHFVDIDINKQIVYCSHKPKENKMEYQVVETDLNIIDMEAIWGACSDFKAAMKELIDKGYRLSDTISKEDLLSIAHKHNGIQCLLNAGFIKKVEPEVFYQLFDKFQSSLGKYTFTILCVGSPNLVQLVSTDSEKLCTGESVKVNNMYKITKEEFAQLEGGANVRKVKEKNGTRIYETSN